MQLLYYLMSITLMACKLCKYDVLCPNSCKKRKRKKGLDTTCYRNVSWYWVNIEVFSAVEYIQWNKVCVIVMSCYNSVKSKKKKKKILNNWISGPAVALQCTWQVLLMPDSNSWVHTVISKCFCVVQIWHAWWICNTVSNKYFCNYYP